MSFTVIADISIRRIRFQVEGENPMRLDGSERGGGLRSGLGGHTLVPDELLVRVDRDVVTAVVSGRVISGQRNRRDQITFHGSQLTAAPGWVRRAVTSAGVTW